MIADCADAITNASVQIFGHNVVRVHCWAHVIRNIDKKLVLLPENTRAEVRADIMSLQLSKSQAEFDAAKVLWTKKWTVREGMDAFIHYFTTEYLDKYDGWFEGRALGSPSTNNCLEATNNNIKNEATLRNRLPMNEFIDAAMTIVKQWSTERDSANINFKEFALVPTLTTKLMTEGYTWFKSVKDHEGAIKYRQGGDATWHFIASGERKKVAESDISKFMKEFQRPSWRNFNCFKKYQCAVWAVSITGNDWQAGSCTCPVFMKSYTCKHLLGIAIFKKFLTVSEEAKAIPIGQKRKRGRPTAVKKALLVQ